MSNMHQIYKQQLTDLRVAIRQEGLDDALRIEEATNRWLREVPTLHAPSRCRNNALEEIFRRNLDKTLQSPTATMQEKLNALERALFPPELMA